jgi:hypothetical protein
VSEPGNFARRSLKFLSQFIYHRHPGPDLPDLRRSPDPLAYSVACTVLMAIQ